VDVFGGLQCPKFSRRIHYSGALRVVKSKQKKEGIGWTDALLVKKDYALKL